MSSAEAVRQASRPFWNRTLKCGISLGVFIFSETQKRLLRALGRTRNGKCVVVYYHSVPASERQLFAAQLDRMLRWTRPVRSEKEADLESGSDCVVVTFDDGFEDFLTQALPELERRKIPATVFAIADGMDREFGWEGYAEKLLSLEQMCGLPAGLVTIGSHTLTHPLLTELEESEAWREIKNSRTKLEELLERNVGEFSFPFGGFNEKLVELCRQAGYERIYTTLPAFAFEDKNQFVVGRVRVDPSDWALEFRLKVAGAYRWLPMAIALKRNVVSAVRRSMARPSVRPSTPRPVVR